MQYNISHWRITLYNLKEPGFYLRQGDAKQSDKHPYNSGKLQREYSL